MNEFIRDPTENRLWGQHKLRDGGGEGNWGEGALWSGSQASGSRQPGNPPLTRMFAVFLRMSVCGWWWGPASRDQGQASLREVDGQVRHQ